MLAAPLTMNIGKNTRKPVAAASPMPSTIDNARSEFDMKVSLALRLDLKPLAVACPKMVGVQNPTLASSERGYRNPKDGKV